MRIFNKILGIVLILIVSVSTVFAIEEISAMPIEEGKSVVVISDRLEQANVQYLIYPEVSEMIAAEVINELNLSGAISSPSLTAVREKLRSPELIRASNELLKNYRYTYNLNYTALRKIAKQFGTTNILLVTGALDTTTDFMKPTWWAFLNIPGENVVKSEYRLYTYMALVDVETETVTWLNTYHRQITSPEFGLANTTYSPDYRQLTKLKKGSETIARDAVYRVESVLTPLFAAQKTPPTKKEWLKLNIQKKYDEHIQNVNNKKQLKEQKKMQPEEQSMVLKTVVQPVQEDIKPIIEPENVAQPVKEFKESIDSTTKLNEENTQVNVVLEESKPVPEEEKYNIQVSPINVIIPKM